MIKGNILKGKKITFIVGDALIGKPPGAVSLLPAEKYADITKAREGLRRLLKYNFDSLLVGDGVSDLMARSTPSMIFTTPS